MGNSSFSKWYEGNKDKLSQQRKERYRTDPEYRQKVIQRSLEHRMAKRGDEIPPGYEHHMAGAAEIIGVTIWSLREWRKKNYFPEPLEFKGRRWFTGNQLQLLIRLRQFFDQRGVRTRAADKADLSDLVDLIYGNW